MKNNETDSGLWAVSHFEMVGDVYKAREADLRGLAYIDSGDSFVIRVDGRAFHTFTRSMRKPFASVFQIAMIAAMEAVVKNMKCQFAYMQSDEISFAFKGSVDREALAYEHPFKGRVDKLLSIVASLTSVAFYDSIVKQCAGQHGILPHFDARLVEVGQGSQTILSAISWRENDAMRNAVAMVAQSLFSQQELHGKNVQEQIQMIDNKSNGVGYERIYTPAQRRGSYMRFIKQERPITEEEALQIPVGFRPDVGSTIIRTAPKYFYFNDWGLEARQVLWD